MTRSAWLLLLGLALSLIGGVFLYVKLDNDQIVLTQPDSSMSYDGRMHVLPEIGQTFVPTMAGLRGVVLPLYVAPEQSFDTQLSQTESAEVRLHIRTGPDATQNIRTASVPIADIQRWQHVTFRFEPLPASFGTRYYFALEFPPTEAQVSLPYGPADSYIQGGLYIDGNAHAKQANFFLAYDRRTILWDWLTWPLGHGGQIVILILMTLVPGGALLVWLAPRYSFDHIEWLALAVGSGVALYPIFYLWSDTLGLQINGLVLVGWLSIAVLILAIGGWFRIRSDGFQKPCGSFAPQFTFWLIFILSAIVRIAVIRGVDVPLWADSLHHTMISQLLVEHQGLFRDWSPYASIISLNYHFGLHTLVAVYQQLSGVEITHAMLTIGQWLNLLTVPMAYLMGRRLAGSAWAGPIAALLTGLVLTYPAFYVNWGRYTQLAGQVILPVLAILTWLYLRSADKTDRSNVSVVGLLTLVLAGLSLTHYRVLFFYPAFVLPILLLSWAESSDKLTQIKQDVARLARIGGVALVLILPQAVMLVGGKLWALQQTMLRSQVAEHSAYVEKFVANSSNIFEYTPTIIVLFATLAALYGSWQQREGVLITSGWLISLILLGNPHYLSLPGTGTITYFAILIALYLPLSVLVGYFFGELSTWLSPWLIGGLIVLLGLWYMPIRIQEFQPLNILVTKPDEVAMAWMGEHLPTDAKLWGNGRLGYDDYIVASTDGGWWIPFLAERTFLIPPLAHGTETTNPPSYRAELVERFKNMHADLSAETVWREARALGATHLYLGQRQGEVWRGPEQTLDPTWFADSPQFQLVYRQDQVWIFELLAEDQAYDP